MSKTLRTPKAPAKLPGEITISRTTGGGGDNQHVRIEIMDGSSRTQIVSIRMGLLEFAQAVLGCACQPMEFEARAFHLIGTKAENKTEDVPFDRFKHSIDAKLAVAIKAALKPFEVDGWEARECDMTNGHRNTTKDGVAHQSVVFFRHVDAEGKPV